MASYDGSWLIDEASAVDVGQGYRLTMAMSPSGELWPILQDTRQAEPQDVALEPAHFRGVAPHELTGRLPEEFRQLHCGAPTRSGQPCRIAVDEVGGRCRHHEPSALSRPVILPPSQARASEQLAWDFEADA